jgi:integrase
MRCEPVKNKKGEIQSWRVIADYKHPLTAKRKRASITFHSNTMKARRQAERDLQDKIDKIIEDYEHTANKKHIRTFGDLKHEWLKERHANPDLKERTIERAKPILKRIEDIIGENYLLEKITPIFMQQTLNQYTRKYDLSQATLQHVKSHLNMMFQYAVHNGIIVYSPMSTVKVKASKEQRDLVKARKKSKSLELHEIAVMFKELKKRDNPDYYDLAVVLFLGQLRIGEGTGLEMKDVDFQNNSIDINKTLVTTNLTVDNYFDDDPKTTNAERLILLPEMGMNALKRAIGRSIEFDRTHDFSVLRPNGKPKFHKTKKIFRTKLGTPLVRRNFTDVIDRIEKDLRKNCLERYGFEWTKHCVTHSYRRAGITFMQSGKSPVELAEIMARVGHSQVETTMGYSYSNVQSQRHAMEVVQELGTEIGISNERSTIHISRFSTILDTLFYKNIELEEMTFTLEKFRDLMVLKEDYAPRHITANILPKVRKELKLVYPNFSIETLREGPQKVIGYKFSWKYKK